jgi:multiple sugar transport system permease protein
MKSRQRIARILTYVFLSVSSFIMVYPVLFMVLASFTTTERFIETVVLPIPNTLNLALYRSAMTSGMWQSYVFTLQRVLFYLLVNLLVGLIGGYIFSKLRFPGRSKVFLLFLSGMLMPGILMMVPQYVLIARFPLVGGNNILGQDGTGFIGDWTVLFVYGWAPPFAIFLMKQAYDMLPGEYEDAAKMDGAGFFTIIFGVYGPLLKPPMVALAIVTFLGIWNDYLWPSLTIAGHPQWYPITMVMQITVQRFFSPFGLSDYPAIMARTLLATWPPAAVYFILQRYFVQGMVASGLKG